MDIVILSAMRLLGESLAACLNGSDGLHVIAVVDRFSALRDALQQSAVDLVLIDVTQEMALDEVSAVAQEWPRVGLVAVGLNEQRDEVARCGQAGFIGYVARGGSVAALHTALCDAAEGRLACPAEISSGLMRALFRPVSPETPRTHNELLTRREEDVLRLLGTGLSNKEIARELNLSVATVKHHVHHILEKLNLPGRTQVMRKMRDQPWLAHAAPEQRKRSS
jgi:DNA-binding NarL/FixJ family response regulator